VKPKNKNVILIIILDPYLY